MHRFTVLSLATATALVGASSALASAPSLDPSWRPSTTYLLQEAPAEGGAPVTGPAPTQAMAPTDIAGAEDPDEKSRAYDIEINFRGRMVSVPDSIMDIWYFNEDDPSWADSRDRPRLHGYALGLETVLKADNANGIFYIEYIKSRMNEGYWDDREEPPDPFDGDFIAPSSNLGLGIIGANYAYEAHFVRTAQTNGAFGMSFLVGGGLGVGVMFGELERWGPGVGGTPGFTRYDSGEEQDGTKNIPKVFPMVDVNAGLRFNFGDRFVLRVEGGLHTMLYYGAAAGIMF